jgi:hypothetical protein
MVLVAVLISSRRCAVPRWYLDAAAEVVVSTDYVVVAHHVIAAYNVAASQAAWLRRVQRGSSLGQWLMRASTASWWVAGSRMPWSVAAARMSR